MQFPHCDSRVLHAPLDNCSVCNSHPEWQELRKAWGIAFSGHSNETVSYVDYEGNTIEKTLIPCPSEWERDPEIINRWGGNVAMTPEREKEMGKYFEELGQALKTNPCTKCGAVLAINCLIPGCPNL